MSLGALPIEIVILIVDEFQDNPEVLKTISLVSKPFHSASRLHLFRILRMNSIRPSFDYKCHFWSNFVQRSPSVLSNIRTLELGPPIFRIYLREPLDKTVSEHWATVMAKAIPSIQDDNIQFLMENASCVEELTLRFEFQSWKRFSPSFRETVENLLARDTLTSLNIEDVVDFPLHILRRCSRLRHLSLIAVSMAPELDDKDGAESISVEGKGKLVYLKSLTLILSDEGLKAPIQSLSSPVSCLDITRLQRLSLNITGTDGRNALQMMPRLTSSITTLELRVCDNKEYDLVDLNNFPNLRSIFISASYNTIKHPIYAISRFFLRSGPREFLEELNILFRFDSPEFEQKSDPEELSRICSSSDWRFLERDVIARRLLPSLEKMKLSFRAKDVASFVDKSLLASLGSHLTRWMPTLDKHANINIDIVDDRFEKYAKDL